MPGIGDKDEMKRIFKEAMKEWMDEKLIIFGKWSLMSFGALIVGAITYFILWANGWSKH